MRKSFVSILAVTVLMVLLAGPASSQSFLTVKFGTMNPKDTKAGLIFGVVSGKQVDERMDFGLSADLFVHKFTQESTVEQESSGPAGTSFDVVQREIDYSVWALPIMAQLTVRLIPNAIVVPYIGAGAGYELLFSKESNYETGEKDSRFYHGFGWQLLAGGSYWLGSSSAIMGEVFYNGSTLKRSQGKDDLGFPIHEELNFSGLGFRIGLRLGGW